ncbi:unnamed protein product [Lampetra planeri]
MCSACTSNSIRVHGVGTVGTASTDGTEGTEGIPFPNWQQQGPRALGLENQVLKESSQNPAADFLQKIGENVVAMLGPLGTDVSVDVEHGGQRCRCGAHAGCGTRETSGAMHRKAEGQG